MFLSRQHALYPLGYSMFSTAKLYNVRTIQCGWIGIPVGNTVANIVTQYEWKRVVLLSKLVYTCYSLFMYRKDKSRINAQSRRTTHAQLLKELGSLLPFPEKVIQQIDYNSILRLVLCYFRMKNMAVEDSSSQPNSKCILFNKYCVLNC